jgi:hypothetical protein
MNRPAPVSRELLARMLSKVEEMRHALNDSSGVAGATGVEDGIDVARAMAALEDLERRVRRMLETEA